MRKKLWFTSLTAFTLTTLLALSSARAEEIYVTVNGMICDFCAQSLEKIFGKEDSVSGVTVNLDTKIVTIHLKDKQDIGDDTINRLIDYAGYTVAGINRDALPVSPDPEAEPES